MKYIYTTMIFKLNENESIELKHSFRSAIYFEQINGKNIDLSNISSNEVLSLFYCVVIASLQLENRPIISMMELMNAIDMYNDSEKCITEFAEWYIDIMRKQYDIMNSDNIGDKKETENVKKKKKKD